MIEYNRVFEESPEKMMLYEVKEEKFELNKKLKLELEFLNGGQKLFLEEMKKNIKEFLEVENIETYDETKFIKVKDKYYTFNLKKIYNTKSEIQNIVAIIYRKELKYVDYSRFERYINLRKVVYGISSKFITASELDIDRAINESIKDIGELTEASRVYIFTIDNKEKTTSNTHEWCSDGVEPQIDNLQDLSQDIIPWWMDRINNGKTINIMDVSKLPEEANKEKEILEMQEIKSLVVVPMYMYGKPAGFLGLDNVFDVDLWTEENLMLLKLTGEILGKSFESKNYIKEIRTKNQELEETIKLLNRTQMQLIHREKLAGIGQLAAGVAHEINNPLGFVVSNFDIVEEYSYQYKELLSDYRNACENSKDIETLKERLKEIKLKEDRYNLEFINEDIEEIFTESKMGLDRVIEIVRSLRTFSRKDQTNDFNEYSLNEGIKSTLIVAKNEIKYDADVLLNLNRIPDIKVVGAEINQVILNLIINSIQAIKEKDANEFGKIEISTYADEEYVYCSIKDNGIGIDKEIEDFIFNPFFTTKAIGEGTGLGLSISYDIIANKHKGEIMVESEKNLGTVMTLKLPI